ncbi:hypothetical protein LINGRAHAP2_LOCUS27037 [Linum grandiflorum]
MKLWVRLEFVPDEIRSTRFASGFLGLIGAVQDVGMFSSPDLPGYFLRGFVRLDLLRPFFGRRIARDEHDNEFWVRLCYEGLPPVCFRCGRLGHNHGRCPTPDVPLNLEDRGPWMSLPAGVYRRVNEFTLQLEPSRRSSQQSADLHLLPPPARPRPAAAAASSLPPPMPPSRSGRDGLRSDASTGHRRPHPSAAGARSAGKRPQLASESARPPPGLPPSIAPASPESVGSSSASLPPGFHCGETSGMQMSWLKGSSLLLILLMPTLRWWIIVGLAITLPLESTGLPGLLGPSALGRNPSPGLLPPFLDFSPNSLIQLAGLGLWAESGAGVGLLVAGPLDSLPGPVVSSLPEAAGAVVACSDPQLVPVDGGVDVARPAPAL